jgi:Fe-S oxidoreductase
MQIAAIIISLGIAAVGLALFAQVLVRMYKTITMGQPVPGRTSNPWARTRNLFVEFGAHTRMARRGKRSIGAAHWFVMVSFGLLFFTLVTAFGQLFSPSFQIPVIGHWWPYQFVTELFTVVGLVAIVYLMVMRLANLPRAKGRKSRFFGSVMWQAYYVEYTILGVLLCILALRGAEGALENGSRFSMEYFFSAPIAKALFQGASVGTLHNVIWAVATLKIVISFAWMITISLNSTMGVAWHRFLAFFNIWFKKKDDGGTALGALNPMLSGGQPINFEDPDEDAVFGVGKVEDFGWKGLLDFSTCTECGRCQEQCPAWNTDKPLSPKLMVLALRDHAHAKAPYILAGGGLDLAGEEKATEEMLKGVPHDVLAEAGRPLVGSPEDNAVFAAEALWSCTTCGACVEQCPVDIEHVDHIVDMRRYQVMIESAFPSEAGTMLKNIENKGNPWGMPAKKRLDWVAEVDFDVPIVGEDVEDLSEIEYLYWVGCAGSLEDRAKKTTKAFAELLHIAGVKFAILGGEESCTGDPARRLGNEFLFQMQAQQNVEMLNEVFGEKRTKKIVATCPHCFNSLANEYPQVGGHYEVIHHTQLLDTLVAEGRLTPITPIDQNITYHDPCYLGRHNKVYTPPREIIAKVPGLRNTEMHRCKEKGFCCGAGGARMWMEERIGKRINTERVDEALSTNPDVISTACPYCLVMLGDSITARKQSGEVPESMEVVDVSQLLLRSVK